MKKRFLVSGLLLAQHISFGASADKINEEIQAIISDIKPKVVVAGEKQTNQSLTELMAHYQVPGISIAVVHDGELRWAKGFGIADSRAATPVIQDTLFQAGSISKPIAALAIIKLVAQGKVQLDADVDQYLTGWSVPKNSFTDKTPLTLRHLLTHTGGVTVHGFPGYTDSDFPSTNEVLNGEGNTANIRVDTQPGTQWRYSGGGYTIMQKVVEDVTDGSFEQFVDSEILAPLGMSNSTYQQPLARKMGMSVSAAYDHEGNIIAGGWHHYPEKAAAGLWTTPTDIAKYIIHMQQRKDESLPLNQHMVSQILTQHMGNWGLGPELETVNDTALFSHGGKNAGFTNHFFATTEVGSGVVVMANGDNANNLINEIELTISDYYGWDLRQQRVIEAVDLTSSELLIFEGRFLLDVPDMPGYYVTVSQKQGRLIIADPNQNSVHTLVPTSSDSFANLQSGSPVKFELLSDGQADKFVWAGQWPFVRVPDAQ